MSSNFIMAAAIQKAVNQPVTDPSVGQVAILMHFDGPPGTYSTASGMLVEERGHVLQYSGIKLDQTQKVFGATSVYLNGHQIRVALGEDVAGLDDFTIEMWFRPFMGQYIHPNTGSQVDPGALFSFDNNGLASYLGVFVQNNGRLYVQTKGGGVNPYTVTGAVKKDQWQHFALTRKGTELSVWLDGKLAAYINHPNVALLNVGGIQKNLTFGTAFYTGYTSYAYVGHMDEIRLVKGVAVYQDEFTPPTEPFTL